MVLGRRISLMKSMVVTGTLDMSSWFYRNCRIQRRKGAKICQECPFRKGIEAVEKASSPKPRMRCQKGRTCPKQPGNALPILPGDKLCTGCDRTGKDRRP